MPTAIEHGAMRRAYEAAASFARDRAAHYRMSAADRRCSPGGGYREDLLAELSDKLAAEFAEWAAMKAAVHQ